jgi:phenylalanyl-tRNA synthetase alpha subunit
MDKFGLLVGHWTNRKGPIYKLFDKQEMTKMQKQIDKNQSTKEIEKRIILIKNILQHHLKREKEQNNYIVLIDNSDLHHKTIDKINEWLAILGESLKAIASKQLRQIVEQTNKYNKDLNAEMNSIELLKILLRVISDIKDISMDMEFKIVEVQEQFRVLKMYDYEIEPEIF